VRSDDLRDEPRWPRYAPAAVELGVLSGLSFKLYTADRTAGALNLFSFKAGVWDTDAETTGAVLAAHAAAAILARRHGEQMQAALSTRDRIGQAKGIIMERYGVKGTVALNSDVCERYPQIIDAGNKLGWEWMGHGKNNARGTLTASVTSRATVTDTVGIPRCSIAR